MAFWEEAQYDEDDINSFAVFIGYLSMGVRGLALLVVTWTTVVLLGGFVSDLHKKDFWSLTAITLIQTAGVFDFLIEEKSSDVLYSSKGLATAVFATVLRPFRKYDPLISPRLLALVLLLVQALVFAVVLCSLVVLYLLGLYISTGIALWRLIQHDYGNTDDGAANLKPALDILYSLAVAQGVLFGYKKLYAWGVRFGLAEGAASYYSLDTSLVSDYLDETLKGCMKDPSFSRGRNLVTYAMDLLMEPGSYLSGIRMIGTFLLHSRKETLIKQLLTASSSFRHIIQRLLDTLGPRSPYSSELREHAARIVFQVAGDIRLEQFPGGLLCISSLLDSFEEHCWRTKEYERDWLLFKDEREYILDILDIESTTSKSLDTESTNGLINSYQRLVLRGLSILERLAADEDNCRVISNTEGLVSKIMAPLISDELHRGHHDEWSSIADESLRLMSRLMATPGKTGRKLRCEISGNNMEAIISTLGPIIECHECTLLLKRQAVEILLDLSVDTSSITASCGIDSTRIFIWILLLIVFDDKYSHRKRSWGSTHWVKKSSYSNIRKLAGDKLQFALSKQSGRNDTDMLQSFRYVLGDLARTLLVHHARNNTYRVNAAKILQHLYCNYDKDDEYLEDLEKSITEVVPQVFREILGCGSTGEESALGMDLEKGSVSHDNGQQNTSSSQQNGEQDEGIKLQEALISLCEGIYCKGVYNDELNEIAEEICSEQKKPVKNFCDLVMKHARELLKKKKAEESAKRKEAVRIG